MSKENKSRYALLGMLSFAPMSGYGLKKTISTSIGHFWNESYPQIYPMLKQLEAEGLTTSEVEKLEGKPDRHVYRLTSQGEEELRNWLARPFEDQIKRHELLLKIFFADFGPISLSREHVQHHRAIQSQLLQTYEQMEVEIKTAQAGHPSLSYWLMTLSHGKHMTKAELDWCDETLALLEAISSTEDASKLTTL